MSWLSRLQPASFRGVAFFVEDHEETGGRRVDLRQYPQRDTPSTEDLGREADGFRIRAYVIADLVSQDYIPARDALRTACRAAGPATLVHPYLGSVSVNCRRITMRETIDRGGIATFDLEFCESGLTPSPTLSQDTSSSLLGGLGSLLSLATKAFAIGSLIASRPGVLLSFGEIYLGSVVNDLTGLPSTIVTQIAAAIGNIAGSATAPASASGAPLPVTSAVTGLTGDPIAIAVSDAFAAAAAAITAQPDASASDPVLGLAASITRMAADPSQGLASLAEWGQGLPAPSGLQVPLQTALQQQMIDLVRGCAVIAIAQVYAGTEWVSSNAAADAKAQLLDFLDERATAAAAADQDALYQGWLGITGLATADLVQRALALPSLTPYTARTTRPAAVLAQLFYQDGSRANDLVALNDVVHPSFMPLTGVYLA